MSWIINNWELIVAATTASVTAASIIAKLTPTEVDNKVIGYLLKIVDILAINNKPTEIKTDVQ